MDNKNKKPEKNKISSCNNILDCFFPSNRQEFGIRMCLYIFGLLLSSCIIVYNRACGLYNVWNVVLCFIYIIQIIILFIAYLKLKNPSNRCLKYEKDCNNNRLFNLLILGFNIQILYFTLTHTCNTVHPELRCFIVVAIIFRLIQLVSMTLIA